MKAATIQEIKSELKNRGTAEIQALCLRLARFKSENKELLTFLLFEADDLDGYIRSVKAIMDEAFPDVRPTQLHFAKKTLRKILRITNRHIRYTGSKQAEAELLLYFAMRLKDTGISLKKSVVISNMYKAQVKKITAAIDTMHEDLQYEYKKQLLLLEER